MRRRKTSPRREGLFVRLSRRMPHVKENSKGHGESSPKPFCRRMLPRWRASTHRRCAASSRPSGPGTRSSCCSVLSWQRQYLIAAHLCARVLSPMRWKRPPRAVWIPRAPTSSRRGACRVGRQVRLGGHVAAARTPAVQGPLPQPAQRKPPLIACHSHACINARINARISACAQHISIWHKDVGT